ncbi:MAG: hypothetical protein WBM86_01085 [Waterburya sp.]
MAFLALVSGRSILNQKAYGTEILLTKNEIENSREDSFSCPDDVKELTALLLNDLPAYSNRVIQRTQNLNQLAGIENYIITANKAEFEPLGLPRLQYNRIDSQDPKQVFFTVLERQYFNNKMVVIQTYHWLFLTQTDSGWRTVMMFSRFGNAAENLPPTPPRETTNGIIGQGVQSWLKDCRAGAVRT